MGVGEGIVCYCLVQCSGEWFFLVQCCDEYVYESVICVGCVVYWYGQGWQFGLVVVVQCQIVVFFQGDDYCVWVICLGLLYVCVQVGGFDQCL